MSEEKRKVEFINVPIINLFSVISFIEDILIKMLPEKYSGVAKHYIKAKIEFLNAIKELLEVRVKDLEKLISEEKIKKEKVNLE